jgi:hypothetical protein
VQAWIAEAGADPEGPARVLRRVALGVRRERGVEALLLLRAAAFQQRAERRIRGLVALALLGLALVALLVVAVELLRGGRRRQQQEQHQDEHRPHAGDPTPRA